MLARWFRHTWGRPSPPRIYLHIGAMKTGTTYLQGLLQANREALERAGFHYPGNAASVAAVRDVLSGGDDARTRDSVRGSVAGRWERLCEEMLHHRGKASVLSMEFLSFASPESARRILESLAGAEVHVILTVRDAATAIPAQWQTSCRNRSATPYQRQVRAVRRVLDEGLVDHLTAPTPPTRLFLRTQGIPRMLEVWVPLVGAERVHVITVPPKESDPTLLWRRFAKVVGVRPKVCSAPPRDHNPSLGHASTELLRRINAGLGQHHRLDYDAVVKARLARHVLAPRAGLESPVRLNRRARVLANRWNRRVREAIEEHAVRVSGSLHDELPVVPPDDDLPVELPKPTDAELLDAAAVALPGLREIRSDLAAGHRRPTDPGRPASVGDVTPERWSDAPDPVAAAVAELVDLTEECLALHRALDAAPPDDDSDHSDGSGAADDVDPADSTTRA